MGSASCPVSAPANHGRVFCPRGFTSTPPYEHSRAACGLCGWVLRLSQHPIHRVGARLQSLPLHSFADPPAASENSSCSAASPAVARVGLLKKCPSFSCGVTVCVLHGRTLLHGVVLASAVGQRDVAVRIHVPLPRGPPCPPRPGHHSTAVSALRCPEASHQLSVPRTIVCTCQRSSQFAPFPTHVRKSTIHVCLSIPVL